MRRCLFSLFVAFGFVTLFATETPGHSSELEIRYRDVALWVDLHSPGTQVQRRADGTIENIAFERFSKSYQIAFFERQRVSVVKEYGYVDGKLVLDGACYSFNESGKTLTEAHWLGGKLHGKQLIFNDEGRVIEERLYDHGFPVGAWTWYYGDGTRAAVVQFPDDITVWQGTEEKRRHESYDASQMASMAFHKGVVAVEVWYGIDGAKHREKRYRVYKDNDAFVVADTGDSILFDGQGNPVRKVSTCHGISCVEESLNDKGVAFKKTTWSTPEGAVEVKSGRVPDDGQH